jgi:hypothetical protein
MLKKQILTAALFLTGVLTYAQKAVYSIGVGPTIATAMNKNYKLPIGASIKGQYGIAKSGAITADITYLNTDGKKGYLSPIKQVNIINTKIGILSHLNEKSNFFVQAEVGISHYSFTGINSSSTGFIGAVGVGYYFPINNKSGIEIAPSLNYVQKDVNISRVWFMLNLAYKVKFYSKKAK